MAERHKDSNLTTKEEATEIIELAIEDIDVLTRAFEVINEVCEEMVDPYVVLEPGPEMLN